MAGVVFVYIFLDEASIYAFLDRRSGLVGRGIDAVSPQTPQTQA